MLYFKITLMHGIIFYRNFSLTLFTKIRMWADHEYNSIKSDAKAHQETYEAHQCSLLGKAPGYSF